VPTPTCFGTMVPSSESSTNVCRSNRYSRHCSPTLPSKKLKFLWILQISHQQYMSTFLQHQYTWYPDSGYIALFSWTRSFGSHIDMDDDKRRCITEEASRFMVNLIQLNRRLSEARIKKI